MEGQKQRIENICAKFNLQKGLINNLVKSQPQVKKAFFDVIQYSKIQNGEKKIGNMLYSIATKLPTTIQRFRQPLAEWVGTNDISNPNQLDFTIQYLKDQQLKGGADIQNLKKDCGIGIKLTNQQILALVNAQIDTANQKSKKFQFLGKIKQKIPYVEGKQLKDIFESAWKAKGLPENVIQPKKAAKPTQKPAQKQAEQPTEQVFHIKDITELIGRQMKSSVNSKELIEKKNSQFGDIVLTRFPPEPNGYLHIGHCKAMRFNFMQAKISKGNCYLRFDDTNPTKENIQYIENIKENIRFMGYEPWKITHASDNFDILYEYAITLIKQGDAFVCSQPTEEMRKKRGQGLPSKYRDRSIEENLKLFDEMRLGLHEQGAYSLRAKIDYKHANTTLRDPVIYRIKFHSHPHVGDKWCIYPLYDYTHPICDSLEGITHSLCSLEFQIRRQLYYWVLQRLNIYRPHVWEYSRLNITYTVLSKRKLHELIFSNKVKGWDDPRILTINGMRRRGYPAEALNNFCDTIGVSRRGNENYINFNVLENQVRKYLDIHAPRTMAVLEPVELILQGHQQQQITVPNHPKNEQKGNRKIKLSSKIWVQRSDIKIQDEKGFYGIAPNKIVGLKYAGSILIKEVKHQNGKATQVIAQVDPKKTKPNSYLNWLSIDESFDCSVRNYGLLFNHERPGDTDDYLNFFNANSQQEVQGAKVHKDILNNLQLTDKYQFERKGFYCLDKDTDLVNKKLVWNLTVGLVDRNKK